MSNHQNHTNSFSYKDAGVDIDAGDAFDDLGSHFAMEDYHVFSMEDIDSPVKDHGIALHVDNVKWARNTHKVMKSLTQNSRRKTSNILK